MTSLLQSPLVAAIAGGLAVASLVLLHRLRARPARRTVATTLFWNAAAGARTRSVLFDRFARVGSFLLLLLILLLCAVGVSGVSWPGSADSRGVVLVLDAGYTMSTADSAGRSRLDLAVARAEADLRQINPRTCAVVLAGAEPRLLAGPDAPPDLARRALRGLHAEPHVSSPSAALRLAGNLPGQSSATVLFYTDRTPATKDLAPDLVSNLTVRLVGESEPNSAIVSTVYFPEGDSGTLVVRTRTSPDTSRPLRVRLTAAESTRETEVRPADLAGEGVAMFPGVRPTPDDILLTLIGDAQALADDNVTLHLPPRPPLTFHVTGPVPAELHAALSTVGAIVPEPASGAIRVIVHEGPAAVPAASAVEIATDLHHIRDLNIESAITGPGPSLRSLATSGTILLQTPAGEPLTVADFDPAEPTLHLSAALFSPGATVARRPAFFLLLQRTTEALARRPGPPVAIPFSRQIDDPVWPDVQSSSVSLTTLAGSRATADLTMPPASDAAEPSIPSTSRTPTAWHVALLAAFVLLLIEAVLHARRKVV